MSLSICLQRWDYRHRFRTCFWNSNSVPADPWAYPIPINTAIHQLNEATWFWWFAKAYDGVYLGCSPKKQRCDPECNGRFCQRTINRLAETCTQTSFAAKRRGRYAVHTPVQLAFSPLNWTIIRRRNTVLVPESENKNCKEKAWRWQSCIYNSARNQGEYTCKSTLL